MTEDEMVGWHHQLRGHEFEQVPGAGDEQEGLAFCISEVIDIYPGNLDSSLCFIQIVIILNNHLCIYIKVGNDLQDYLLQHSHFRDDNMFSSVAQ